MKTKSKQFLLISLHLCVLFLGNCVPPCASVNYNVQETMIGVGPLKKGYNFSDVTVRFSSSEFIPKRRQESYSNLDLLSAIGANLGFFVSASVISVIELVYYFSIRICFQFILSKK